MGPGARNRPTKTGKVANWAGWAGWIWGETAPWQKIVRTRPVLATPGKAIESARGDPAKDPMNTSTPAPWTGWYRRNPAFPWRPIVGADSEAEAWVKLLGHVASGDKCVLPSGQHPADRGRPTSRE
jgi:hypothetical protein